MFSSKISYTLPAADAYVERPHSGSFSWKEELCELLSPKFFNIIWWPYFQYKQRYFTHSALFRYCNQLPGFSNLWKTIQKSAFAYNHLFLDSKCYRSSSSITDLADITTLALFFGDEFIDGIYKTAGKCNILKLLASNREQFYLKKNFQNDVVQVEYNFNLLKLLPTSCLQEINIKYQISYQRFYTLLRCFLKLMNQHLSFLSYEKASEAADKIVCACNNCLDSYFHDVDYDAADGKIHNVSQVLHFHDLKTRRMQEHLLDLRCTLAGKEYMQKSEVRGWIEIMSVVQIVDDLQDAAEDDDFQDNLVISTAFHLFPQEWQWFKNHKLLLLKSKQKHLLQSLFMPCTTAYCLGVASDKIRSMNWEQQKIMHYLVFKNWFVGIKGLPEGFQTGNHFLKNAFHQLRQSMAGSGDEIKGFIVDACFHSRQTRDFIKRKIGRTKYYELRYNLFSISLNKKAAIFNKLVKGIYN